MERSRGGALEQAKRRRRCILLLSAALRLGDAAVVQEDRTWKEGLVGTHFWDCNGAGCDATTLSPWKSKAFVFPSQYAPTDPADFKKGARYGEKLWLIGAASDALAELLGPDKQCCGHDRRSQACGRCLLVRNPTAVHADWTAVVMKKSRCPPESKGCEKGQLHMDFAVPGLDNLAESKANVCGESMKQDTFITRHQSAVCGRWQQHGNSTINGCNCSLLPENSPEQEILRRGCEVFVAWGWTTGSPELDWTEVECPPELEERVKGSFGAQGVHPPSFTHWFWWGVAAVVIVCCVVVFLLNRLFDHRDQKKKRKRREGRKGLNSSSSSESSDSSSETSEMQ